MRYTSHIKSEPVSRTAHFLDVHPRSSPIDNRGVVGRSSIVTRAAASGGGAAGVALLCAAILGALTLTHLVRAITMRRIGGGKFSRLEALRRAIVGVQKKQIAAVLGPPRATIGRGHYLTDDTWYYPIDPRQRLALAIEFDRGVARQTQVVEGVRTESHHRTGTIDG